MNTKWTLLVAALLVAAAPSATGAATQDLQPLFVTDITGTLRVEQDLPSFCSDIDHTTSITGGRIEMSPWEGYEVAGGGRSFELVRASVFFAPFTLHASCDGPDQDRDYTEVGVQLAAAARFVATPSSPGVYAATIPWPNVLIYEAARADGELEVGYKHPKEDVTATIDYAGGTVQMRVVLATKVHIDACSPYFECVDGHFWGTLTAELSGTILFPDSDGDGTADPDDNCRLVANRDQSPVASPLLRVPYDITVGSCAERRIGDGVGIDVCDALAVTVGNDATALFSPGPNVVTWTAVDAAGRRATARQTVTVKDQVAPDAACVPSADPDGGGEIGFYRVSGGDDCGAPAIRLGRFALADGEVIRITRSPEPGIELVGVSRTGVRHFRVGPDEQVVEATDEAGNAGRAECAAPREKWSRIGRRLR